MRASSLLPNSLSSLNLGRPLFLCCTSLHVSWSHVSASEYNVLGPAVTDLLSRGHTSATGALNVAAEMRLLTVHTGRSNVRLGSSRWLRLSQRLRGDDCALLYLGAWCPTLATQVLRHTRRRISVYIILRDMDRSKRRVERAPWLIMHWLTSSWGLSGIQGTLLRNSLGNARRSGIKQG